MKEKKYSINDVFLNAKMSPNYSLCVNRVGDAYYYLCCGSFDLPSLIEELRCQTWALQGHLQLEICDKWLFKSN